MEAKELDKTKFYISPSKEQITVWIDGEWKFFYSTKILKSQLEAKMPSDKEIDDRFPISSETTILTFAFVDKNKAKREGAKWLKQSLQEPK